MNWHTVEKRKISWRELWAMDANRIKSIVYFIELTIPFEDAIEGAFGKIGAMWNW